jgi:hypothetical protein
VLENVACELKGSPTLVSPRSRTSENPWMTTYGQAKTIQCAKIDYTEQRGSYEVPYPSHELSFDCTFPKPWTRSLEV